MAADMNQPLESSASSARRLAPQLCRKDPVTGEDCSWYHGLWPDLRLLGLAAAPEQQSDFFQNAFAHFSGRPLRLLICGAADDSILAHVLSACSRHKLAAHITVVDMCETPLFFNRRYAEQAGVKIETVAADIFNYKPDTRFDGICSHGFLSQFPPSRREELVRQWSRLLAPGGTVLLVNRVRPGPSGAETRFSEKQGREFCETVAEKLRHTELDQANRAGILARAEIYVRRLCGYALTEEELVALFHQAGFRIEDCQIISRGAPDGKLTGPAVPSHAKHACLRASKIQ
jgi:SAM-dependent methyltransferase